MRMVQAWDNLGEAPEGWGSHVIVMWDQLEVSDGVYNWAALDKALAVRHRPCFLQVVFSLYDKTAQMPVDRTADDHRNSLRLAATPARVGTIPRYDAAWRQAYTAMVQALANRYRNHPDVAGYWHAAGWNQETQAAATTNGGEWGKLAVAAGLRQEDYLTAIAETTAAAVRAWAPQSVWLPGAPSPGAIWGNKRRDVIAAALEDGAGYMDCGLQPDSPTAFGIGGHAGLGMIEIASHSRLAPGFEEGPILGGMPGELYWNLLHARAWGAAFVCLYRNLSGSYYPAVASRLPAGGARWIVFRDAEFGPATYIDAQGRTFGHRGEPGCWASGIEFTPDAYQTLHFNTGRFGCDRWVLHASNPLLLALPGLQDGLYPCVAWAPDGTRREQHLAVREGFATLASGEYHRVDVLPVAVSDPVVVLGDEVRAQGAVLADLAARVATIEEAGRGVAAALGGFGATDRNG